MPLIIPNTLSFIEEEEAISLDIDSIFNSDPIFTIGARRYDIIYTSIYYNAPHLYAPEYNGNEVASARLRKILALHPDTDQTSALFITKLNEPIEEKDVEEYATHIGSTYWTSYSEGEETDQDTIHFHLLQGKISENCCLLDNNESEDYIPPHELISQLTKFIQPWTWVCHRHDSSILLLLK